MEHTQQPSFHVLGRRNNITMLRVANSNKRALTRTAPKATPAGQLEQFDSRFVSVENCKITKADSYASLFAEFHK